MNWHKKAQILYNYGKKYNEKYFNQFCSDWDNFLNMYGISKTIDLMDRKYFGNKKIPDGFSSYMADKILEYFPINEQVEDDFDFILRSVPHQVYKFILLERPELDKMRIFRERSLATPEERSNW